MSLVMVLAPNLSRSTFFKFIFMGKRARVNHPLEFFATSHGKGVVDGIARTVKRAVWHFSYFLMKNGRMPMTHQMHCIKTNGDRKLLVADTSDSTQFRIVHIRKKENSSTTREELKNGTIV